jgi:molybdopterin/thiamine biosynthesis adenylyltransferase
MESSTPTLTLTAQQITRLRDHLLHEDELERVAYVYCTRSGDDRLLAEEIVPVADDQLLAQDRTRCRPTLEAERSLLQDCRDRGMHPLIIHSHAFDTSERPDFSSDDHELMDGLQTMITGLWPDTTVMFAVLNTTGITAAVYDPEPGKRVTLPVTVLGHRRLDTPLNTPDPSEPAAASLNTARHDRSIRALTEHGQQALAETHIGLIGAGGLGSIMAVECARYGVRQLTVVDPDIVEESNLPRLFGAYDHHIGRPKIAALREHLWKINPTIEITPVQDTAENAADTLKQVDLLVAGVDQVSTRMWLNQFAVQHLIPYVDAGVVIETRDAADDTGTAADAAPASSGRVESMEGYIQLILPGANACFDCFDRGDPEQARLERLSLDELEEELERGYIEATDLSPEPAVVPLNGIVASKTIQLLVKYITGYARPADYLRFEGIGNTLTELTTHPSDRCMTCGDSGILGQGDRDPTHADLAAAHHDLDLEIAGEAEPEPTPEAGPVPAADDRFTAFFDS